MKDYYLIKYFQVSSLNDLSDVTISSATTGQLLVRQASGQFANVSVISGGTY